MKNNSRSKTYQYLIYEKIEPSTYWMMYNNTVLQEEKPPQEIIEYFLYLDEELLHIFFSAAKDNFSPKHYKIITLMLQNFSQKEIAKSLHTSQTSIQKIITEELKFEIIFLLNSNHFIKDQLDKISSALIENDYPNVNLFFYSTIKRITT